MKEKNRTKLLFKEEKYLIMRGATEYTQLSKKMQEQCKQTLFQYNQTCFFIRYYMVVERWTGSDRANGMKEVRKENECIHGNFLQFINKRKVDVDNSNSIRLCTRYLPIRQYFQPSSKQKRPRRALRYVNLLH